MKWKKQKQKQKTTLSDRMKRLVLMLVPFFLVYIAISAGILVLISKQNMSNFERIAELYAKELDNRFFTISRSMLVNIMEDDMDEGFAGAVATIEANEDELAVINAVSRLRTLFTRYLWEYGQEYHFFVYFEDIDKFIDLHIEDSDYSIGNDADQLIRNVKVSESGMYSIKRQWESLALDSGNFIYKAVYRQGVYLGCYVDVESLLTPFQEMGFGVEGYVQLMGHDGQIISRLSNNGILSYFGDQQEKSDFWRAFNTISIEMLRAPFLLEIYLSNDMLLTVLFMVLLLLLSLALLVIGVYGWNILYFRNNVLKPIQEFSNQLVGYDTDDYKFSLSDSNLLELEQADEQFKKLLRQIKKLKITLYEQELEKQNMEIENLKLQIRPHFYLNCLNFIYSMIDFKMYNSAKSMSMLTSEYLRYIFRSDKEMVTIDGELQHCRNYLDILVLKYEDQLSYYIEQDPDTTGALICPFFIQSFVENAIKHAVTLDEKVMISITVFPETVNNESFINIYIADTGSGFPEEMLGKLENGESLLTSAGRHVGIQNNLKRMKHYFGEKAYVNFENSPLGGAVVDIHIPRQCAEEGAV